MTAAPRRHDPPDRARIEEFDFRLPEALIALRPAVPRDQARLLHVGRVLEDRSVLDLPQLLRPGDLLVVNDTRVMPVFLVGRRGRASVTVTLHARERPDTWRAFARPARRLRLGDRISFVAGVEAEVAGKEGGEVVLRFGLAGAALMEWLERHGAMPLPPYIRRAPDARDRGDYQTLFAQRPGAIAAPTAGLHFTPRLVEALERRGVGRVALTLHVGAGTFLPIRASDLGRHRMNPEWGTLGSDAARAINETRARGGRVVAVGSTSLRLIETAADANGLLHPFEGETSLFIAPGYRFKVVDVLLTNFHLPRSTLFVLVCAFAGVEHMRRAYAHAIERGYRFYSYGDCCLIERGLG